MKIELALLFFIVSFSIVASQSVFSQEIDLVDLSPIFQSGVINTQDQSFLISNNFDVNQLSNGKIVRISGYTVDGNFYYVYHLESGNTIKSFGKIFLNNQFVPLVFTKTFSTNTQTSSQNAEPKSSEQEIEKPESELLILGGVNKNAYWKQTIDMTFRVFNATENPSQTMNRSVGWLDDVNIQVILTNHVGEQLANYTGKTGPNGYYENSYTVRTNFDITGVVTIQVNVEYQGDTNSKNFTSIIYGRAQGK